MVAEAKIQDPADKLDYEIDWQSGANPGLADGETIGTSTWAAYDDEWIESDDLVIHDGLNSNTDTTATGWISIAPTAVVGTKRYFTNHIVTDQGRELSWSIPIKIKEL